MRTPKGGGKGGRPSSGERRGKDKDKGSSLKDTSALGVAADEGGWGGGEGSASPSAVPAEDLILAAAPDRTTAAVRAYAARSGAVTAADRLRACHATFGARLVRRGALLRAVREDAELSALLPAAEGGEAALPLEPPSRTPTEASLDAEELCAMFGLGGAESLEQLRARRAAEADRAAVAMLDGAEQDEEALLDELHKELGSALDGAAKLVVVGGAGAAEGRRSIHRYWREASGERSNNADISGSGGGGGGDAVASKDALLAAVGADYVLPDMLALDVGSLRWSNPRTTGALHPPRVGHSAIVAPVRIFAAPPDATRGADAKVDSSAVDKDKVATAVHAGDVQLRAVFRAALAMQQRVAGMLEAEAEEEQDAADARSNLLESLSKPATSAKAAGADDVVDADVPATSTSAPATPRRGSDAELPSVRYPIRASVRALHDAMLECVLAGWQRGIAARMRRFDAPVEDTAELLAALLPRDGDAAARQMRAYAAAIAAEASNTDGGNIAEPASLATPEAIVARCVSPDGARVCVHDLRRALLADGALMSALPAVLAAAAARVAASADALVVRVESVTARAALRGYSTVWASVSLAAAPALAIAASAPAKLDAKAMDASGRQSLTLGADFVLPLDGDLSNPTASSSNKDQQGGVTRGLARAALEEVLERRAPSRLVVAVHAKGSSGEKEVGRAEVDLLEVLEGGDVLCAELGMRPPGSQGLDVEEPALATVSVLGCRALQRLAAARRRAFMDAFNLVVFGGLVPSSEGGPDSTPTAMAPTASLSSYDAARNEWRAVDAAALAAGSSTAPPEARHSHSATRVGSHMVVYGGSTAPPGRPRTSAGSGAVSSVLGDVHVLDLNLMRWVASGAEGSAPMARCGHTASLLVARSPPPPKAAGGQLTSTEPTHLAGSQPDVSAYEAPGWRSAGVLVVGGQASGRMLADVRLLDVSCPTRPRWAAVRESGAPMAPRAGHAAAVALGGGRGKGSAEGWTVWFLGGRVEDTAVSHGKKVDLGQRLSSDIHCVRVLPPGEGGEPEWRAEWTPLAVSGQAPPAREGATLTAVGAKLFLLHGWIGASAAPWVRDCWIFDCRKLRWISIAFADHFPSGRFGAAAALVDFRRSDPGQATLQLAGLERAPYELYDEDSRPASRRTERGGGASGSRRGSKGASLDALAGRSDSAASERDASAALAASSDAPWLKAVAGQPLELVVQARDARGEAVERPGETFHAAVYARAVGRPKAKRRKGAQRAGDANGLETPFSRELPALQSALVLDNQDGTYGVRVAPLHAGDFVLCVTGDGGAHVRGSPLRLRVQPAVPCHTTSVAAGAAMRRCVVGEERSFSIAVFDATGNPRSATLMAAVPSGGSALLANGQAQLSVTLEGPTRQSAASVPQPEVRRAPSGEVGLYTASYKMREAGEYKLRVKVDGYSLPGSPFRLSARPGETDATRTTAHGKGLDGRWQAGRLATFTIISRDRFGNKCLSGGCQWRVTYMSSGGDGNEREQHASVTDNSDGTYHVQVRLGGRDCGAHNETCFRHTTRTF